jgi:hypothetical protein
MRGMGFDIQVQFAFLRGSSPALSFAPEGINRYFCVKRDKLIAMLLREHYLIILLIHAKINFNLFDEVVGERFGEVAPVSETFHQVLSIDRPA